MLQQENKAAHDKGGTTDDQCQTQMIHPAVPEMVQKPDPSYKI
jgi:hypothetical protein